MQLRIATLTDLPVLARWFKELREDERMDNVMSDEEIQVQMHGFLTGSTYKTYFLEEGVEVVGYGMVDVIRKPMYLRHLFIKRDSRRNGYGRELVHLLMATHGMTEIDIDVMVWNQKAINFYETLGFEPRYHGMRLRT